ncbi:ankyrin [Penicillium odoratum]|uniref:ankyrin n=1 Tax=Penicillium odoratum TaxID=1167516 RepID=UPI00254872AC|nr:ankyrin [Penicillium odoratum]KAJ5745585.1 ankyrin [Penicillium odoratum]
MKLIDLRREVIQTSIDINHQREDDFETPLTRAVHKNHEKNVKLLLGRKDIDIHVEGGHLLHQNTALQYAAIHDREEIVRLLLAHSKMDIAHSSEALWTVASERNPSRTARSMKILLEYGLDPNMTKYGETLLATAVQHRVHEMRDLLIEDERVDLNCLLLFGQFNEPVPVILQIMAMLASDKLNSLFKHRARINFEASDHEGRTALLLMAGRGHLEWCQDLLEKYPEMPFVPDKDGNTPVSEALSNGRSKICAPFLQLCAMAFKAPDSQGQIPAFQIIRCGDLELFKMMHAHLGTALVHLREHGRTPFAEAIGFRRFEMFNDLVGLGADPNEEDHEGRTLLMRAVDQIDIDMVDNLLVLDGIDIDRQDQKGWTAYVWAKFPPPKCKGLHRGYKLIEERLLAEDASKGPLDDLERTRWPRKLWYSRTERRV